MLRRLRIISFLIVCLAHCSLAGQTNYHFEAGRELKTIDADNLHQYFVQQTISDSLFNIIWLKSYKRECTIARSELRHLRLLHINQQGRTQMGELICHRSIAQDLLDIFLELYKAHYPIQSILLVDHFGADDERSMAENNTSCFNFRYIQGSQTLSKHSRGRAIDINPLYNPCYHRRTGLVEPKNGRPHAQNRQPKANQPFPYINTQDLCYKLFIKHGFRWGGAWPNTKDYQHFEK